MRAVNLIPPEERGSGAGMGIGRSGGTIYVVFGLLAGLAVMAFLYGSAARKISSDKAEVVSLNARAQAAQAKAAALAPYTSFVAMREQREQAVETLVNSRFDWANAFHELGRVLPADVSLSSLGGTVGSGTGSSSSSSASSSAKAGAAGSSSVSSATPPGSVPTFTLAGCTTSQANVALVLDRLRLMNGVDEVNLQSSTKSGVSGAGSSSTSSGGSGAGNCGSSGVTFNLTVTFDALPTLPASGSSPTSTVAATSSASSSTGNATSTGAPR